MDGQTPALAGRWLVPAFIGVQSQLVQDCVGTDRVQSDQSSPRCNHKLRGSLPGASPPGLGSGDLGRSQVALDSHLSDSGRMAKGHFGRTDVTRAILRIRWQHVVIVNTPRAPNHVAENAERDSSGSG